MSLVLQCCLCENELPSDSILSRKFCNDCKFKRQKESQNRKNQGRAAIREFNRIKINLFKNWVMWGVKK